MNISNLSLVKRSTVFALMITWLVMPVTAMAKLISSPFTASFLIQETVNFSDPTCPSSHVGGTITGTGISSLLGGVSVEAKDCITPLENSAFSFEGKMIFTISNGDEIFADYHGLFVPTGFQSIYTFKDSLFSIKGGTGGFLHATGGGKLLGGEDTLTGRGLMQVAGTISGFEIQKKKGEQAARQANELADGSSILTFTDWSGGATSAGLNSAMSPHGQTLGNYFYRDQDAQLFAVNGIPEAASLSLLGIGLASLVAVRRHRSRRMGRRIPATTR